MKKVNLTLSRLALLSAFGLAFAGGCDEGDKKDGNTNTPSTPATPATPAAGLTQAQVEKIVAEEVAKKVGAGGAGAGLDAAGITKFMKDAAVKGAIETVITDHGEIKAWTGMKADLGELKDKKTQLLALANDNDKIVRATDKPEAELLIKDLKLRKEAITNLRAIQSGSTPAQKLAGSTLLSNYNYRGTVTVPAATALGSAAARKAIGEAFGELKVTDAFTFDVTGGAKSMHVLLLDVPVAVAGAVANAQSSIQADGTLAAAAAIGA